MTGHPTFPKHYDGKRFFNPNGAKAGGVLDFLRWKLSSRPEPSPDFVSDVEPARPPTRVEGNALSVTLVNHSTVLLQQNGVNILTDPIWSERASPFASLGPRRHRAAGVRFENLPPIDIVLVSHNHYDHLDLVTLRRLAERKQSQFVVPLKLRHFLQSRGIAPVHESDWGDAVSLAATRIYSVPAMHFSARGPFDGDRTLWCGFVIQTEDALIYFAGDTGFGEHFAQIRERFGAPRLALLPIGAYEPRWFMSGVHMAPDDALRAHNILGAQTSVAIHHGTFQLADEGIDTPKKRLAECAPGETFLILNNGQSVVLR